VTAVSYYTHSAAKQDGRLRNAEGDAGVRIMLKSGKRH